VKRSIAFIVAAGLVLGGCGTTTTKALTVKWMNEADQDKSYHSLHADISKTVQYLRASSSTQADLHTLCSVLNLEIHAANDYLPTPDTQTTDLLAKGYDTLATATTQCDEASTNPAKRAAAIENFRQGFGDLYFGMERLYQVLGRTGTPR
jgi:predicted secreted protein